MPPDQYLIIQKLQIYADVKSEEGIRVANLFFNTKKQFGEIYHAAVSQGKATQERVPNFLGWCEIIMMMWQ